MNEVQHYNPFEERKEHAREHKVIEVIDLRQPETGDVLDENTQEAPILHEYIDSFAHSKDAVDNFIIAVEKGYIRILSAKGGQLELQLAPIHDIPNELVHITEIENFRKNIDEQIWGGRKAGDQTYLQTNELGVEAYLSSDYLVALEGKPKQVARLYIDTQRLKKHRMIYLDSESLNVTEEEFGHSFAVFGGIPRDAIMMAEIVEIPARDPREFIAEIKDEDVPDEKDVEQEVKRQRQRLKEFLKNTQFLRLR